MAEEKIKKDDFIELEFTSKLADGTIFDTNIKEDTKKANLTIDTKKIKPFILSVGNNMIIKGLDKSLEEKEIGKKYIEKFQPEDAFGKRDKQLIKMISLTQFTAQKINPQRGMQLNLDGQLVRILSVSGGRVLVDFNNPLAGKEVTYEFKIKRKVTEQKEKINALQEFFFRKIFPFEIKEKKIIFKLDEKEKQFKQFIEMMGKPFEKILKMKVSSEVFKKKEDKKQSSK